MGVQITNFDECEFKFSSSARLYLLFHMESAISPMTRSRWHLRSPRSKFVNHVFDQWCKSHSQRATVQPNDEWESVSSGNGTSDATYRAHSRLRREPVEAVATPPTGPPPPPP